MYWGCLRTLMCGFMLFVDYTWAAVRLDCPSQYYRQACHNYKTEYVGDESNFHILFLLDFTCKHFKSYWSSKTGFCDHVLTVCLLFVLHIKLLWYGSLHYTQSYPPVLMRKGCRRSLSLIPQLPSSSSVPSLSWTHTLVYLDSIPRTPSCCYKYSLKHHICVNPQLKIDPNKSLFQPD